MSYVQDDKESMKKIQIYTTNLVANVRKLSDLVIMGLNDEQCQQVPIS
jgi:hypothetical protein